MPSASACAMVRAMRRARLGSLDATLVPPNGKAAHAVVLCHGFGAPGDDLVSLAEALRKEVPAAAERALFVFPEAPVQLSEMGPTARAWWRIDGERYATRFAREGIAAVSQEVPPVLGSARRVLRGALDALWASTGVPVNKTLLGGFSQGAMVAVDAALALEEAPFGVAALSGALIAEPVWRERAAKRSPLPVLVTHGRSDPMLPFESGQRLAQMFESTGHIVDFVPFAGGHAIPRPALLALAALVSRLVA